MINLSVNNEKQAFSVELSVEQLLVQLNIAVEKHAVAVNGEFVPRSTYSEHLLVDGDKVDILTAVQGG